MLGSLIIVNFHINTLGKCRMSNVNQKGMFAFHCGNTGTGNIIQPDKDYESSLSLKGLETCANTNFPCLSSAKCLEYNTGICCECQNGFYGNGRSCLVSSKHRNLADKNCRYFLIKLFYR